MFDMALLRRDMPYSSLTQFLLPVCLDVTHEIGWTSNPEVRQGFALVGTSAEALPRLSGNIVL